MLSTEKINILIRKSDKFINKLILQSKKFVIYACFEYGKYNHIASGEKSIQYIDDFQYFAFTKSTKTLISIRTLLKNNHNEDVLVLLRSVFESYISSRYISEKCCEGDEEFHIKNIDDFVFIPMLLNHRLLIYNNKDQLKGRNNETVTYTQKQPSALKLGKDSKYFTDLYEFFCNYAHCNYSIKEDYFDKNLKSVFSIDENNNPLFTRVLVLFVYTRLFELIVTVDGEEFDSPRTEKICYNLVIELNTFLDATLSNLHNYIEFKNQYTEKHIKMMIKHMRNSLKEELGSLNKDFLKNK